VLSALPVPAGGRIERRCWVPAAGVQQQAPARWRTFPCPTPARCLRNPAFTTSTEQLGREREPFPATPLHRPGHRPTLKSAFRARSPRRRSLRRSRGSLARVGAFLPRPKPFFSLPGVSLQSIYSRRSRPSAAVSPSHAGSWPFLSGAASRGRRAPRRGPKPTRSSGAARGASPASCRSPALLRSIPPWGRGVSRVLPAAPHPSPTTGLRSSSGCGQLPPPPPVCLGVQPPTGR